MLSKWRNATILKEFDDEIVYLKWCFDKKLKGFKSRTSKGFKLYNNIVLRLQNLQDFGRDEEEATPTSPTFLVEQYSRLMYASHMLDFTIWNFRHIQRKIDKAHIEEDNESIDEDQIEMQIVQQGHNMNRLSHWWSELWTCVNRCFVGTGFVDSEKTYQVDQEGFNREVLKIIKENDDIKALMNSTAGSQGAIADKSKAKKGASPKKKKGGRKAGKKITDPRLLIESKTFEKLEAQRVLVEILLKVDPTADADHCNKNLTNTEIEKLRNLADPYDAMGNYFPTFASFTTREDLQRLVIKAAGIDDGEF